MNNYNTRVVLTSNDVRLSYPNLYKPNEISGKYTAAFMIPKNDPIMNEVWRAVQEAMNKGNAELGFNNQQVKHTIQDGDSLVAKNPEYANHYIINASSSPDYPPQLVDEFLNKADLGKLYAGCYVNSALNFFPYNHPTGGKGIGCGINSVRFNRDGERFGGGFSVEDDYADLVKAYANQAPQPMQAPPVPVQQATPVPMQAPPVPVQQATPVPTTQTNATVPFNPATPPAPMPAVQQPAPGAPFLG